MTSEELADALKPGTEFGGWTITDVREDPRGQGRAFPIVARSADGTALRFAVTTDTGFSGQGRFRFPSGGYADGSGCGGIWVYVDPRSGSVESRSDGFVSLRKLLFDGLAPDAYCEG